MRLKINLEAENVFNLNSDYRSYLISFIKKVFQRANKYEEFFNKKAYKPYVYSAYLGKVFRIDKKELFAGKHLSIIFSSGDPYVFSSFYNGLLSLYREYRSSKISEFKILGQKAKINNFVLLPLRRIKGNRAVFKTMSICIITNKKVSKKNFKEFFLIPTDNLELFNECLNERLREKLSFFKNVDLSFNVNFIPREDIREVSVKHYEGYLRGFKGTFEMEGPSEVLQFVYDYGFGVRTGQGFGLLEIVKEL